MRISDPMAPMFGADERARHLRAAIFAAIHQALEAERLVSGALNGPLVAEAVLGAAAAVIGQQVEQTASLDQAVADIGGLFGSQLQTEICVAWAREWAE